MRGLWQAAVLLAPALATAAVGREQDDNSPSALIQLELPNLEEEPAKETTLRFNVLESAQPCGYGNVTINGQTLVQDDGGHGSGSITTEQDNIVVASWKFSCVDGEYDQQEQLLEFEVEYIDGKEVDDVGFSVQFHQTSPVWVTEVEGAHAVIKAHGQMSPSYDNVDDEPSNELDDRIAELEFLKYQLIDLEQLIYRKEKFLSEVYGVRDKSSKVTECDSLKCVFLAVYENVKGMAGKLYEDTVHAEHGGPHWKFPHPGKGKPPFFPPHHGNLTHGNHTHGNHSFPHPPPHFHPPPFWHCRPPPHHGPGKGPHHGGPGRKPHHGPPHPGPPHGGPGKGPHHDGPGRKPPHGPPHGAPKRPPPEDAPDRKPPHGPPHGVPSGPPEDRPPFDGPEHRPPPDGHKGPPGRPGGDRPPPPEEMGQEHPFHITGLGEHPPPPPGHKDGPHHGDRHRPGPPFRFRHFLESLSIFRIVAIVIALAFLVTALHTRCFTLSRAQCRERREQQRQKWREERAARQVLLKAKLQDMLQRLKNCLTGRNAEDEEKDAIMRRIHDDDSDSDTMSTTMEQFRAVAGVVGDMIAAEEGRMRSRAARQLMQQTIHTPPSPTTAFPEYIPLDESLPAYDEASSESSHVADGLRYTPGSSAYTLSDSSIAGSLDDVLGRKD